MRYLNQILWILPFAVCACNPADGPDPGALLDSSYGGRVPEGAELLYTMNPGDLDGDGVRDRVTIARAGGVERLSLIRVTGSGELGRKTSLEFPLPVEKDLQPGQVDPEVKSILRLEIVEDRKEVPTLLLEHRSTTGWGDPAIGLILFHRMKRTFDSSYRPELASRQEGVRKIPWAIENGWIKIYPDNRSLSNRIHYNGREHQLWPLKGMAPVAVIESLDQENSPLRMRVYDADGGDLTGIRIHLSVRSSTEPYQFLPPSFVEPPGDSIVTSSSKGVTLLVQPSSKKEVNRIQMDFKPLPCEKGRSCRRILLYSIELPGKEGSGPIPPLRSLSPLHRDASGRWSYSHSYP